MVRTAAELFDKVVVLVAYNHGKRYRFEAPQRQELFAEAVADLPNVEVEICSGLVAETAREIGACAFVKGLRSVNDFESEQTQARVNLSLSGVPTVFIPASAELAHVSSSLVKELSDYGAEVADLVPEVVEQALRESKASTAASENDRT